MTASNATRFNDLTGQRFGDLTAVSYKRRGFWLCRCRCGRTLTAYTTGLRRGTRRACNTCRRNPWKRVDKDHRGGCWVWTGTRIGGYGRLTVAGRTMLAHRYFFTITIGPIPTGMKVLHSCDNPPCVNPSHLWLGTQAENIRDMVVKGRRTWEKGEKAPTAKLTNAQARAIRNRWKEGESKEHLASVFSVCLNTIRSLCAGVTYQGA